MYIGSGTGITVLAKADLAISSGTGGTIAVPTGISWISVSTDGTQLANITGGGITGSYLLISSPGSLQLAKGTGSTTIGFESYTLGPSVSGSVPANTAGFITLGQDQACLLQKRSDDSWLVVLCANGRDGEPGSQGPQGFQGSQGPQGDAGAQGGTGGDGPQGPQGTQGVQGFEGIPGNTGPQGNQGATGFDGPPGNQGPTGYSGTPC